VNVFAHPAAAERFQLRAYPVFAVYTHRGAHSFWLTKKLSANALFNLITRVGKAPDWVSFPFVLRCMPYVMSFIGSIIIIFESNCQLRGRRRRDLCSGIPTYRA
jgi:hypothetical protein